MIRPWPAYANPQLSRTSRTSTCTHRQLSSCSWAIKKKKSGVSLPGSRPWSDFLESFFHLTLYEQPHFLSVCGDSVSDAHLASRRYSDSLSLSLSLSLTHTHTLPLPSQIRAVSTFLLVWFVLKRVRESRGFVESKHELQRYWINNKLSSLTIDASTCMAIRKDSDWSEKSFPRQTNFENISLSRKRGILLG